VLSSESSLPRDTGLASLGRRLNSGINLAQPAIPIIDHMGGDLDSRRKSGVFCLYRGRRRKAIAPTCAATSWA
jgi:hypothetical protein